MINSYLVKVNIREVILPRELYEAMERPKKIRMIPSDNGCILLSKYNFFRFISKWINFNSLIYLLKRGILVLLVRVKNQPTEILFLQSAQPDSVIYKRKKVKIPTLNEYHIVNYHPNYYLMPVESSDPETKSREMHWGRLHDYHEHLDISQQDESATKISIWMAKEIFSRLDAKSFLEIGCGSGRNLYYIKQLIPRAEVFGIEINKEAVAIAQKEFGNTVQCGSLYDLKNYKDNSIDVVFSAGVLMHVPHNEVRQVIADMNRIARIAVVHYELEGPTHAFDYHRYLRNYREMYLKIYPKTDFYYEVFPEGDFKAAGIKPPFYFSILIKKSP